MTKHFFENASIAVLVLCALTVTGMVVRRELFAPSAVQVEALPGWERYAERGHVMGSASAPVRVVIFSDFQCPACKSLATDLGLIRRSHPGQISIVYRHYPLPIHPYAIVAARASECASKQGKFERFHDALFAGQSQIGRVPWTHFASLAGVPDSSSFLRCVADTTPVPAIALDTVAGNRLGVNGTPTFLINGAVTRGAPPLNTLEELVTHEIEKARHD